MFNLVQIVQSIRNYYFGENEMARILKNSDGSGTLYVNGVAVKTYARARDARRGAARLGVVVA